MNIRKLTERILTSDERRPDEIGPPPPEIVGFFVRWVRNLRQWKCSTLANIAHIGVSTVERVERGERVSNKSLERIAEALGYGRDYFTAPRARLTDEAAQVKIVESFGHLEPVAVLPMKTHRQVRIATDCEALLVHRPGVPDTYDGEILNLTELLDIGSFVLERPKTFQSGSGRGRRDFYNDVLGCVRELETYGLNVLFGTMNAPQDRLPGWKVAVLHITQKLTDPGASKRRFLYVDRRCVDAATSLPDDP